MSYETTKSPPEAILSDQPKDIAVLVDDPNVKATEVDTEVILETTSINEQVRPSLFITPFTHLRLTIYLQTAVITTGDNEEATAVSMDVLESKAECSVDVAVEDEKHGESILDDVVSTRGSHFQGILEVQGSLFIICATWIVAKTAEAVRLDINALDPDRDESYDVSFNDLTLLRTLQSCVDVVRTILFHLFLFIDLTSVFSFRVSALS